MSERLARYITEICDLEKLMKKVESWEVRNLDGSQRILAHLGFELA
jgi:hypothetical protein